MDLLIMIIRFILYKNNYHQIPNLIVMLFIMLIEILLICLIMLSKMFILFCLLSFYFISILLYYAEMGFVALIKIVFYFYDRS